MPDMLGKPVSRRRGIERTARMLLLIAITGWCGACRSVPVDPDPATAQEHFSRGEEARRAGRFVDARADYEAAWRLDPSNPYFGAFLGWFLESVVNDYPASAEAYSEALRDGYGNSLFHFSYARALRETADWAAAARHFSISWELALEEEAAGVANDPLRVDRAWFHRFEAGRALVSAGDFEGGRELMLEALPNAGDRYREFMHREYGAFLYDRARQCAADHDWASAASCFEELEQFVDLESLDDLSVLRRFPAYYYRIPYGDVARQLASLVPQPTVRLRFLCLFAFDDPKRTSEKPPIDLVELRKARGIASDLILLLSNGRVSIQYDDMFWPDLPSSVSFTASTYREEDGTSFQTLAPGPTGMDLLPRLAAMGVDTAEIDSILVFTEFPSREYGRPSASVLHRAAGLPLPEGRERIGIVSFPYSLYYSSEMVYLHEFFHLWENQYAVAPKHGFSPDRLYTENIRVHFPGWEGRGQYDYYRYHFETTFSADDYRNMPHP
jgi:tetratricopeptide (TPR) repeat protein